MSIEFGNEWALNHLDELKVFNSLRSQNPKQMMNIVDFLYIFHILDLAMNEPIQQGLLCINKLIFFLNFL
jgi:hypothetical protein